MLVEKLDSIDDSDADPTEPLDRYQQAFRLHLAGKRAGDIALVFGVDERTIYRWFRKYREECRRRLEATPVVDLLSDEVARLSDLEQTARMNAERTKNDRARMGYLNAALRAARARQELLLDVGVLPREPAKIYSQVVEHRSSIDDMDTRSPERTREEVMASIEELLRNTPKL